MTITNRRILNREPSVTHPLRDSPVHCPNYCPIGANPGLSRYTVAGGMKVAENRRFEIPFSSP